MPVLQLSFEDVEFTDGLKLDNMGRPDLGALFDALNRDRFGGLLPRPAKLAWSATMTRAWGKYYFRPGGAIRISWPGFLVNRRSLAQIANTMLHEMVHHARFLREGKPHSHDRAFWCELKSVGGERRWPDEIPPAKFEYACPVCDERFYLNRQIRSTRSCAKCNPRFDSRFALKFVRRLY
jgi:predicted SprT family Zn-dependent metalloprotease